MTSNPLDLLFYGLFTLVNRPALSSDGQLASAATIIAVNPTDPSGNPPDTYPRIVTHVVSLRIPQTVIDLTKTTCVLDPDDATLCLWTPLNRFKVAFGDSQNATLQFDNTVKYIGDPGGYTDSGGPNTFNPRVLDNDSSQFVAARFDLYAGTVRGLPNYPGTQGDLMFTFKRGNGQPPTNPAPKPLSSGIGFSTQVSGALRLMPCGTGGLTQTITIFFKAGQAVSGTVTNEPIRRKPSTPTPIPTPTTDYEVSHFRAHYLFMTTRPKWDAIAVPHFDATQSKNPIEFMHSHAFLQAGSPTCPPNQLP